MADTPPVPPSKHPIWLFQSMLTARLFLWSVVSIVAGAALQWFPPFWRGIGTQAMGWGVVDAAIAWLGQRNSTRKARAATPFMAAREARRLRRLLWINAALDVLYVVGGIWLAQDKGRDDERWRGHGWGIVIQGGFLFLFDVWHGLRTPGPFEPRTSDKTSRAR